MATRRRTTVLWATAVVLGGALTGCGTTSSGTAAPPAARSTSPSSSPSRTPATASHGTTTPATDRPAPSTILHDPSARIGAFSVVPGHPERRAATWYLCRDTRCYHRTSAAVVTSDGFRHRTVVDLPVSTNSFGYAFWPAGPDHFVVTVNAQHPRLIDLHGRVQELTVRGASGPLAPGEVAVGGKAIRRWLAVDPGTGVAHPLSTPPGTQQLEVQPSGQLRVLSDSEYAWSDDGGATWHPIPLPPEGQPLTGFVPSGSDDVHAVIEGGDGATLFPWDRILKSTDGVSWTSYPGPGGAKAYVDTTAVLPDGRLLIDVVAWSDQHAGKPAPRPIGFYAGSNWSAPTSVGMGTPFDVSPNRSLMYTLDLVATPVSVTVYAKTPDQTGVVASTDGGATWRAVRAR